MLNALNILRVGASLVFGVFLIVILYTDWKLGFKPFGYIGICAAISIIYLGLKSFLNTGTALVSRYIDNSLSVIPLFIVVYTIIAKEPSGNEVEMQIWTLVLRLFLLTCVIDFLVNNFIGQKVLELKDVRAIQ